MTDIPITPIGTGETPPWARLPHTCPICGAGPLPLHRSTTEGGSPGHLTYIKHCGHAWARGIDTKEN